MFVLKLLAFVAFFGSIAWFWASPDYEPGIAIVSTLSGLIAIWFGERQSARKAAQSQVVGAGGVGVQAGRDAHVGSISGGDSKDAE
jgi:hypothetical protein